VLTFRKSLKPNTIPSEMAKQFVDRTGQEFGLFASDEKMIVRRRKTSKPDRDYCKSLPGHGLLLGIERNV
jgi:hypothetical protein